jgi:hypothetical protein
MSSMLLGGAKRHNHRVPSLLNLLFNFGPGHSIKVQCRHLIPPNPAKPELTIDDLGTKLFPRLRSEKVAPAGQLSKPKLELQLYNRDKPEITNLIADTPGPDLNLYESGR